MRMRLLYRLAVGGTSLTSGFEALASGGKRNRMPAFPFSCLASAIEKGGERRCRPSRRHMRWPAPVTRRLAWSPLRADRVHWVTDAHGWIAFDWR
jgi:hypothetical protein